MAKLLELVKMFQMVNLWGQHARWRDKSNPNHLNHKTSSQGDMFWVIESLELSTMSQMAKLLE